MIYYTIFTYQIIKLIFQPKFESKLYKIYKAHNDPIEYKQRYDYWDTASILTKPKTWISINIMYNNSKKNRIEIKYYMKSKFLISIVMIEFKTIWDSRVNIEISDEIK